MYLVNLMLVVLLALLQYRLWSGSGSIPDVQRLEQSRSMQQEENRRLTERNASLAGEVMDLKHGLDAIEERARSEMGMIKSGETYYQIVKIAPTHGDGPAH